MNRLLTSFVASLSLSYSAQCQGYFILSTETAPTRLNTIDGPLAGPGIWAHALAGNTADSLQPVGLSVEHYGYGLTFGITVTVPWANAGDTVFLQAIAWDGTSWGLNLADVPLNQIGYTDIVPITLDSPTGPGVIPLFTQPAIVPPIPEPSISSLLIFGVVIFRSRLGFGGQPQQDRR